MAEVTIGGKIMDLLTRGELRQELDQAKLIADESLRTQLAGIKPVRFQFQGVAASSAFALGGSSGEYTFGPEQGWVASVRHLVIQGMTTGTTPDIMNIKRSGSDVIIWQLNGNQFAQTWGRGEILLHPGENLRFESVGTFASTAAIIIHGLLIYEPGPLVGRDYK